MEGADGDAPATVGSGNVVPDTARKGLTSKVYTSLDRLSTFYDSGLPLVSQAAGALAAAPHSIRSVGR